MMNGGLGNGLILAPVLADLERHLHRWRYLAAPNAALAAGWLRTAVGLSAPTAAFPPLWRRFAPDQRVELWEMIETESVDLVVNLRKEALTEDAGYLTFRTEATQRGLECWDLHELTSDELRLPIGAQAVALLRRHGVTTGTAPPDWLSEWRRPHHAVVGCYVGASVPGKRWAPASWAALIGVLAARGLAAEIATGFDAGERTLAERVASSVDGPIEIVRPGSLEALRDWIGSLTMLVSNDTAAVHCAAALGCPVAALYLTTDGAIWQPLAEPGHLATAQSALALACPLMKVDGTCRRHYLGCFAPCQGGVDLARAVEAVDQLGVLTPSLRQGRRLT
jgi:hypothetical protein